MKRTALFTLPLIAALASACSPEPAQESGFPAFGTFDPHSVELPNPCDFATPALMGEFGFPEFLSSTDRPLSKHCQYTSGPSSSEFADVSFSARLLDDAQELAPIESHEHLYAITNAPAATVAAETERGLLEVTASKDGATEEENLTLATDIAARLTQD